jgi:hypothetical protein
MKKLFSLSLLLLCGINFLTAQKTIFSDNFSDNHNKWPTYTSDSSSYLIHDGKFFMDSWDTATTTLADISVQQFDFNKNFSISALLTHTGGTPLSGYGICFGGNDNKDYYSLCITSGGFYRVDKFFGSAYSVIASWTKIPALKTGSFIDNKVQLSKDGDNWKISINDQLINTIAAQALTGNHVGFVQYGNQSIEYDDLKIVQ